ncbi:small GTP-binding protein, putative [Trichomonas vaginalis G3]|uniref:Small GTP-binding protein, putative n=1 Tax=Trichomonas vaginalis (strain ATCC PRA-98 / G3) TaxID=412133 RepID=A2FQ53_TRIV3|nr:GTPase protein [Trichomonas vaginalis G3]EAX92960.1 small GTP-binding protein, putative [Trichomonas vaginalis G3]KAI5512349.1 GTPase protein [Trichomonas vaginalis G3]|eukprot:XP_001305890.1 small GTP-binding protein [Trichomonas vaginalis G3]
MQNNLPRVVVIGNSGVGKTSMVQRIALGEFDLLNAPTVGAGVSTVTVQVNNKVVKYIVWDTAGQEMFRNIVPLYFREVVCCIIVFSLTDPDSFNAISDWLDIFHNNTPPEIPVVIAGNKCDKDPIIVDPEEAKIWALEHGLDIFITSAATEQGILSLFEYVGAICAQHVSDTKREEPKEKKQGCC